MAGVQKTGKSRGCIHVSRSARQSARRAAAERKGNRTLPKIIFVKRKNRRPRKRFLLLQAAIFAGCQRSLSLIYDSPSCP
ncbi:hypothetical protein DW757_01470 [Clostridium sp. AM29-11AC]|nr:hypothetical protein DW757_01470 [Clostridium sp. AM29-11AC]